MLTTELVISIPGHPAPKGSLKCVGGQGGRGYVLIEDNARTKDWRATIAYWVRRSWMTHMSARGQPLGAAITFTLPRPKGHYGTGRNRDVLKPTAPAVPVSHSTGDLDKLLRLVLDALQDTHVLPDDCQIVELTSRKAYPLTVHQTWGDVLGYEGVVIRLYPIDET